MYDVSKFIVCTVGARTSVHEPLNTVTNLRKVTYNTRLTRRVLVKLPRSLVNLHGDGDVNCFVNEQHTLY
jgi:hypothetical protein